LVVYQKNIEIRERQQDIEERKNTPKGRKKIVKVSDAG
jgi:hypothetical protein